MTRTPELKASTAVPPAALPDDGSLSTTTTSSSPTPVTVLTGFLGSGKTTALNALLVQPALRHTAVIINELDRKSVV